MGRPSKQPHQLIPTERKGRARVWYAGRYHDLGPWDAEGDRPADEAVKRLDSLRALWSVAPASPAMARGGPLLIEAWADWRASPDAPPEHSRDYQLVAGHLFGSAAEPGPHFLTRLAAFTAADLMAFRSRLVAAKLSRWTISRRVACVVQFARWARIKGYVTAETLFALTQLPPAQGVKEKEERGVTTTEDVAAVAGRLTSRAGDLLRVLALTGARPSEVCGLTVGAVRRTGVWRSRKGVAIDLGAAGVWCAEVAGGGKMRRKGIQRVLFFGPRAQALLTPRLDGRRLPAPLFETDEGNPYTSKLLRRYVQLACDRAGMPRLQVYGIRHGTAARVQQEYGATTPGLGFLAAQAVLGHAIRGATSGYAGIDYQCAARVMAGMG